MKKKEFEMLIRKIKSKNSNERHKLRELGDAYTKFLKSQYSDDAIKFVERYVLDKYYEEEPPIELHKVFLQAAKYYRENGMYDEAIDALSKISDSNNVSILLQAEMEKDLIRIRRSAENGEIDQEALESIQNIVQSDEEHEIETAEPGKFTEYDLLTSYFEDIPVEAMNEDIFPAGMTKPTTTIRVPNPDPAIPRNSKYIEALSAEKRLEFLKEKFKIERIRLGRDKFTGTIIFEIKDSDLVIAESFFRKDREGNFIEDYGKATYIIPKQAELDLIEMSRGELKEKIGKEEKVAKVNHTSEKYYERLVERFNRLQSEEYAKIDGKIPGRSQNPEGTEQVEETEVASGIEELETQISSVEETMNSEQSGKENNSSSRDDKKQIIRAKNEAFLNDINNNLGNIITPNIMNGLLTRASYSFENLYNKKLKNEIMARLEIMEVHEEQREAEAQKAFLYIRMTKNASMIDRGYIKGEQLDNVLDTTILEYQDAMAFYMKHKDDNLTYNELVKGMKEYIETQKDPFDKEEEIVNTDEAKFEPEENGSSEKPSSELQEPSTLEQKPEGEQERPYSPLVGENIESSKRSKTIDMATKFAGIMERYERITAKLEKANTKIAELVNQYNQAKEATKAAREQEEMAKKATQQAMEEEGVAQKAMQDAQNDAEQLQKEQAELQNKISQIEDLLR